MLILEYTKKTVIGFQGFLDGLMAHISDIEVAHAIEHHHRGFKIVLRKLVPGRKWGQSPSSGYQEGPVTVPRGVLSLAEFSSILWTGQVIYQA
jgi:hypothetical protein